MINPLKSIALNASTFTKITALDKTTEPTPIGWYVEDSAASVGYIFATDESGTDAVNVIPNLPMSFEIRPDKDDRAIFYVKALSGTPNLVLITGLR
jgi:hypothetical protein